MDRQSDHILEVAKIGSPDEDTYVVLLDREEVPPVRTKHEADIIVKWLKEGALDILYGRL